MTSINFKVFGLTRPDLEPEGSRLDPVNFGFPDLPEWEAGALLIWPHQLVVLEQVCVSSGSEPEVCGKYPLVLDLSLW